MPWRCWRTTGYRRPGPSAAAAWTEYSLRREPRISRSPENRRGVSQDGGERGEAGLEDDDALSAAYGRWLGASARPWWCRRWSEPGVEMALGIVSDPQFGPLVMVAAGGVLIETLADRRLALPPLDEARAGRLIDRLEARPLLNGVRGEPAADWSRSPAMSRLSVLAQDLGDLIDALDVNPLIVGPKGCVAVDALVEPNVRHPESG